MAMKWIVWTSFISSQLKLLKPPLILIKNDTRSPSADRCSAAELGYIIGAMYRSVSILLLLVLTALVADILLHSRPVQAQNSPTVYIEPVHGLRDGKTITIKGTQVVGFSCSEPLSCYVLSK